MASKHHGRFPYSAIVDRPPLRWPNDARVALWVIPNIEHYHFDSVFPTGHKGIGAPDMIGFSQRDYGNRVGVWRIMDVLDKWNIRATVALNSDICEYEPPIIDAGKSRSWEWMGHSVTNSRRMNPLPEDEQRGLIEQTVRTIETAVGTPPRGWLGPGLDETEATPDLLKAAGIDYVADWVNDDQPYPMETTSGLLYSIPYTIELNDTAIYPANPPAEFVRRVKDQFDVLYEEGAHSGRVMAIALHPYKTGVPHRIKYLDEALSYINQHDRIWWATGSEIVDAYRNFIHKERVA